MVDRLSTSPRERLMGLVRKALQAEVLGARPLRVDDRLTDLGMNSLKTAHLMLTVEAAFDIEIPPEDVTPDNFRSIASIEALVARLTAVTPSP